MALPGPYTTASFQQQRDWQGNVAHQAANTMTSTSSTTHSRGTPCKSGQQCCMTHQSVVASTMAARLEHLVCTMQETLAML